MTIYDSDLGKRDCAMNVYDLIQCL